MDEMEPMEGEGLKKELKKAGKKVAKTAAKAAVKYGATAAGTALAGPVGGYVAGKVADFALARLKKRPGGVMPPAVRAFVEKFGDTPINSVEVTRTPLDVTSRAPLNMVTLGQFDKAVKEAGYDSAFHLAMIVNGEYQIEKMEVIRVGGVSKKKNTETFVLQEKSTKTIREMFDAAESIMGRDKFTGYDARTNNCQDFIVAMLQGAGILTERSKEFVKQDVREIFKKLPGFTSALARGVTDLAAAADAAIYGQGEEETDVLEGGCEECMSGQGLKKLYKKGKKAAKNGVKYVKKDLKDDATKIAKKVRKATGQGFEYVWDEAQPIRAVLRQGSDILASALNKTNIDALEKIGASIHRFAHADQETLARMLGKQIRVASKGLVIVGKVTSVVGNVMVITGTITGQPELVAIGVAVDAAGNAVEIAGNVSYAASYGVSAAVAGDRKAALLAFLKAVEVGGTGALDSLTGGAGTVFIDLAKAAATDDTELAIQASAKAALVALDIIPGGEIASAVGEVATKTGAVDAATTAIADEASQAGSGPRTRATKRSREEDYSDMQRPLDESKVRRGMSERVATRDVRVNPTGVNSGWVRPKHAAVSIKPGVRKSDFYRRPTVRGFGANYVRNGYRDAPTGEDATGETRSRSRSVSALPVPNYRATGFDGSLDTILENSFHAPEVNRDMRLTDLNKPVTEIIRERTHVRRA